MRLSLMRGLALTGLAAALAVTAHAQRQVVGGIFADRAGKQHPWQVLPTHTLMWDRQPWIPVGGVFAPHYLAEAPTDDNWGRDVKALEVLKSRGVLDIVIDPVKSAADITPAAWQRLVDYLDGAGFRYGIGFGAGLTARVSGTVCRPSNYRIEDPREGADLVWKVADADSARWAVVDSQDAAQVSADGKVAVQDGVAIVPGSSRTRPGTVVLLYPHRSLPPEREGVLPDVWGGFDAYRDRLLGVLGQVKFGPGLRFFLDPLAHPVGLFGDAEYLVPDSRAFRVEWESYLADRYPTIDDLCRSWGAADPIKDFREAARLVPMWAGGRGAYFLMDPVSGKRNVTQASDSRFWSDLRAYRNESLAYYLGAMADLLKRQVADVPVVYTRTQHYSIFTNTRKTGGLDGLGIAAYASGSALVSGGADSVYSQCEEAARPVWCLVTETLDTAAATKGQQPGYGGRDKMFYDLDWLRGMGAKGFFVHGFQVLPEDQYAHHQLLQVPEQIGWLHDYADKLQKEVDLAQTQPRVLPFPANAAGLVHPGLIGGTSVMWVPSLAPGRPLDFGTGYAGYTIALPDGDATVLWAKGPPRVTRILVADPMRTTLTTPDGQPVKPRVDAKRRTLTVTLTGMPVKVQGGGAEVFPIEAAEDAVFQLKGMVAAGVAAGRHVDDYRYQLEHAETNLQHNEPRVAFGLAVNALNGILQDMQPFAWREAESADSQTFSEVTPNEAASGGAYLNLSTEARPGREGYGATWRFMAPKDDSYTVWAACSPPGPQTSPFVWFVDKEEQHPSTEGNVVGLPYLANTFVWTELGRVRLAKGEHSMNLRVSDYAPALGRYNLALDAVLLTPAEFVPNGTAKPSLEPFLPKNPKLPPRQQPRRRK